MPPGSNTQSEKPKENYVSDKTCNNLWPLLANFGEYLALLAVFVKRCFRLTTFPTQGESASRATSHLVQAVRIQKNRKGINIWLKEFIPLEGTNVDNFFDHHNIGSCS